MVFVGGWALVNFSGIFTKGVAPPPPHLRPLADNHKNLHNQNKVISTIKS